MLSNDDVQELRKAGASDDEILDAVKTQDKALGGDIDKMKSLGASSSEIINALGATTTAQSGKDTSFTGAVQYGSAKALEGVGRTLQSFEATKGLGDSAMRYGQAIDNEQDYSPAGAQVKLTSPSTWGNIPRAIVEAAPGAATSLAGGVAGAAAGGAVGSAVPIVGTAAGALLGGITGAGLGGVPSYMGDRLQNRLINNGQPNTPLADASTLDKLIAGGTAFGEGALNRVGVGGAIGGTIKGAGLPALAQLPYQIGKAGIVGGGASAAGDALTQAGDTIGTDKGLTVDPNEVGSAAITGYGAGALARGAKGVAQDVPQSIRFAGVAQLPEAARDVANIVQGSGQDLSNPKGAYKALKIATDTISDEAADNVKTLKKNNAVDPNAAGLIDATLKQLDKGEPLSTDELQAVTDALQKTPGADDVLNSINRLQVLNTVKGKGNVDDASKTVTGGFNAGILGDLTNPIGALARKSPVTTAALAAGGATTLGSAALHAIQHGGVDAIAGATGSVAVPLSVLAAAKAALRLTDASTGFNAPVDQFASRFAQPGPNQILAAAQAAKAAQALQNPAQAPTGAPQLSAAQLAQAAQARAQALAGMHGQQQTSAAPQAPQAAPAAPTAAPAPGPAPAAPAPIPGGVIQLAQAAAARARPQPLAEQPVQQAQANAAPQLRSEAPPPPPAPAMPRSAPAPAQELYRPTRGGVVTMPDADHAALYDFGERISRGNVNDASLTEAKRLLNRFKGFVDDSDEPLANARDLGEMARDYYRDVFDNHRSGEAPDMLASDEARVAWLKRAPASSDAAAPIVTAARAKQAMNGSKPNGAANGAANDAPKENGSSVPTGRTYNYHGIDFPIPDEVKFLPAYLKSLRRNQDLINQTLEKEVYNTANGMLDEKTYHATENHRVALKTARNQDDARGVVNRILKQAAPEDRSKLKETFDDDFFKIWSKKSAGPK